MDVAQHALQHKIGEEKFWAQYGGVERAQKMANDLFAICGNTNEALRLIEEWRNEWAILFLGE